MSVLLLLLAQAAASQDFDLRGVVLGASLDSFRAANPTVECVSSGVTGTNCTAQSPQGFQGSASIEYRFTPEGRLYRMRLIADRADAQGIEDGLIGRWGQGRTWNRGRYWDRTASFVQTDRFCEPDLICVVYEVRADAARVRAIERAAGRVAM